MKLLQTLLEEDNQTTEYAVIYGGRFQPMHPGHFAVTKELEKTFGGSSVYLATSNRVVSDPNAEDFSPFNFDEKRKIIERLFNPEFPIVMCQKPTFSPSEITSKPECEGKAVILVVSEKDGERYAGKNKYYLPLPDGFKVGDPLTKFRSTGQSYYHIVKMKEGGISATNVRRELASDNENKALKFFKNTYDNGDVETFKLIRSKLLGVA